MRNDVTFSICRTPLTAASTHAVWNPACGVLLLSVGLGALLFVPMFKYLLRCLL
jgi:hypothetical protein